MRPALRVADPSKARIAPWLRFEDKLRTLREHEVTGLDAFRTYASEPKGSDTEVAITIDSRKP
eukprot:8927424-Pyramimonas_sp.AAC.1